MKQDIFDVANKVIVLTGAGGILGRYFCEELLVRGAKVIALEYSKKSLAELKAELNNKNLQAIACDIADAKAVERAVAEVMAKHNRVDVLINNAATKSQDPRAFFADDFDYDLNIWNEVVGVNLTGSFALIKAIAPHMVDQGQGSIIQIASLYGVVAADQRIYEGSDYLGGKICTPAVYAATKSAVIGLAKHFAAKLGEHNIRVNCISPGGVSSGQNNEFSKKYSARVPMGRMAEKNDLLGAVLYLASSASEYFSGQNLVVDGGLTVW